MAILRLCRPLLLHLLLALQLFPTRFTAAAATAPPACPCQNTSLCQPIQGQRTKEVYGFRDGDSDNTKYETYDWDVVSTVAWSPVPQLVCHAHARGARVIMAAPDPLPISATDDATARAAWIENTIREVQTRFLDGVVFDFEGPLLPTDIMNINYVLLINETRVALHSAVPGSQISVCLAWNPHGVDGRYYDNLNLIKAADLAYIMSYDTRSQILDQCVASANAALPAMRWGLKEYLTLGADPQKMILGVPWYGYDYTCVGGGVGGGRERRGGNVTTRGVGGGTMFPALVMEDEDEEEEERMGPLGVTCPMALVPFRGVNCSDAAGAQVPFSTIYARLVAGKTTTGRLWDSYMSTPFYNYISEEDGSVHQVHYDDAESLRLKYGVARELGLRGVGPYTYDDLPGGEEGGREGEAAAREMWEALRVFTDEEKGGGKGGLRRGGG